MLHTFTQNKQRSYLNNANLDHKADHIQFSRSEHTNMLQAVFVQVFQISHMYIYIYDMSEYGIY